MVQSQKIITDVNVPLIDRNELNPSCPFTGGDINIGNESDRPNGNDPKGFEGAGATAGDGADAELTDSL